MDKKTELKNIVIEMLTDSLNESIKNIDKVINSGAIDVDSWDGKMIIPKSIATALLQKESESYNGSNTSFAKEVKKNVKNIRCFV